MASSSADSKKVLVLNATGKTGRNVARALVDEGFTVYGTTRSAEKAAALKAAGIQPVIANYTVRADLDRAFAESGAKKVFVMTDYFGAAKKNAATEVEQGKAAIAAAAAAGVDHLVWMSVIDVQCFDLSRVHHLVAKKELDEFLRAGGPGIPPYSIVRPCAFFENLDDPANWNPLKKGVVKFLMTGPCSYVATTDIGRAAAAQFKDPAKWLGKSLDVVSWRGDLKEVAAALEKVSGVKTKARLAMPRFLRRWFLPDLHAMFESYEGTWGELLPKSTPADFKKAVPGAGMSAEEWFVFHGRYANGEKIVASA